MLTDASQAQVRLRGGAEEAETELQDHLAVGARPRALEPIEQLLWKGGPERKKGMFQKRLGR